MTGPSPRDTHVTVFGRVPVLEALRRDDLQLARLLVADSARGDRLDEILGAARRRGVEVRRVTAVEVARISRSPKQDQGVVLDVRAPRMRPLDRWLDGLRGGADVLVLDGLTNPQNVGMVLRVALAAGIDGVVLPRAGVPDVGPLVVKASAGTAFAAPVLRAGTADEAVDALHGRGFRVIGLDGGDDDAVPLWSLELRDRTALVLGGETSGISPAVRERLDGTCAIPLAADVESLNAATAAAVACFEVARRRAAP